VVVATRTPVLVSRQKDANGLKRLVAKKKKKKKKKKKLKTVALTSPKIIFGCIVPGDRSVGRQW